MKKLDFIFKPFSYLRKEPKVIIPFFILALFEGLALYLIYMAPQSPFSKLLAPPIRKFFGENYLHYPANFILMPKLFSQALFVLNIFPGILLNAILIGFVGDIRNSNVISFRKNLYYVLKKIIPISVLFILTFYFSKMLMFLTPKLLDKINITELSRFKDLNLILIKKSLPDIKIIITFFLDFISQSILIYAMCLVILDGKGFFKSLILNFKYLIKLIIPTLFIFMFGAIIYLPLLFIKYRLAYIMFRTFPEIVVYILSLEIFIFFVLNYFITVSTTVLFLNCKKNNENN